MFKSMYLRFVCLRYGCTSAANKFYKYVRRIFLFKQMDFEFALWQQVNLFYKPQQVYRNFQAANEKEFET